MRKVTELWTTKDDQKIRICDMTDEHLNNTIKMLERKGADLFRQNLNAAYSMPFDEDSMAAYTVSCEIGQMEDEGFDPSSIPLYDELVQEKSRRDEAVRKAKGEE